MLEAIDLYPEYVEFKFYYELASIYLQELNVPIRYLELGNEVYLNDEYNKQVFHFCGNSYVNNSYRIFDLDFQRFSTTYSTQAQRNAIVRGLIFPIRPGEKRNAYGWKDALKRLDTNIT
ncbi:MAG: hypothetical protein IPM91_21320 [Bacteroidetes bacterium]|nr:hypothetical protein [Bacteroidota bacterium]